MMCATHSKPLTLQEHEGEFVILQRDPKGPIPAWVLTQPWYSVTRTPDELSIVCRPNTDHDLPPWHMIQVLGQLDFALTGILAQLSQALARAGVPVFAISTFDTDYLLVPKQRGSAARQALLQAGYRFANEPAQAMD